MTHFKTYKEDDIFDGVSRVDALQSVEAHVQNIVGVIEIAHVQ